MTPPLIRLEDVDVALDGATILRGITWRLGRGENWAVLGGNGSGKSTLLRLIRGEIWPAPGRGRRVYALDGIEQTTAVGVAQAMPIVSPEEQERCLRLEGTRTVQQLVESGLGGGDYFQGWPTTGQRRRVRQSLRLLGIEKLAGRNLQRLSTGELRKALIARALAGRPRVLVCDEVCDGLDANSRAALLAALERVARNGTQLLFTTHREEELIPGITHRLMLAAGRVGATGGRVRLRKQLSGSSRSGAKGRPQPSDSRPTLIHIQGASVFLGGRRVLRDIEWELKAGEHWAVLGPNGSGKSTFLKLITGDLHPAHGGSVRRFDFTPRNTLWELRRRIGVFSPEFQAGYREALTGAEVIASGFFSSVGLMQRPSRAQLRCAAALAAKLGFGTLADRSGLRLSYGEFRKVLLARALVHEPELLVLDEPFDGLDATARQEMAGVLEAVARRGTSLVLVTHHPSDLPGCMTRVVRLKAGKIVACDFLNYHRVTP